MPANSIVTGIQLCQVFRPSGRRRPAASPCSTPFSQAQDAVHAPGELEVVRGDQRRHAGVLDQLEQLAEHERRRLRIEVAGRLVGQQEPGALASARAIAVRCCSPPDSCAGR